MLHVFVTLLLDYYVMSILSTPRVKKLDTKLLLYIYISSPNIDQFSKYFYCVTQQEICSKRSLQIRTHLNGVSSLYTTLQNISFQKLLRLKFTAQQTRRAHTEENVTMISETALS